jgi:hypothetical protein
LQKYADMLNEAVCDAYTNLGTMTMEDFLFNWEAEMYTGDVQLDAYIYCVALRCSELYCQGIGL